MVPRCRPFDFGSESRIIFGSSRTLFHELFVKLALLLITADFCQGHFLCNEGAITRMPNFILTLMSFLKVLLRTGWSKKCAKLSRMGLKRHRLKVFIMRETLLGDIFVSVNSKKAEGHSNESDGQPNSYVLCLGLVLSLLSAYPISKRAFMSLEFLFNKLLN